MLQSIELENFKAFGKRTRIDFAPITLILGENSAGKSSILQSLGLLKQTRESREHGALLLPRAETGFVDLGSFQELLFDHDLSKTLVIRVELDPQINQRKLRRVTGGQSSISLEFAFVRRTEKDEVSLEYLQLHSNDSKKPIARFEPIELSKDDRKTFFRDYYPSIHTRRPLRMSEIRVARCTQVTDEESYWHAFFEECKKHKNGILEHLKRLQLYVDGKSNEPSLFADDNSTISDDKTRLREAEQFYQSDFGVSQFIERMRRAELGSVIALDGFVAQPIRNRGSEDLPEFDWGRDSRNLRGSRERMTVAVNTVAFDMCRLLETTLESLYPMGPYRRPPERWYIFTGTNPTDVGYRGDLLPSLLYRRPEVVEQTNEWLHRLQIGYRLDVRPIGRRTRDLFEVRLVDTRRSREVDVALSDVGYGISQVLPFVVQSLASERQIITIEQPEVHVHPRLQADLGDLLAETIKPPRLHRFIIETHSEHLVLRMQKLVRDKTLKPSDLAVIYVSRGPDGARADRLRIGEDGDFIDEWPGGFFPERLRELI